MNRKSNDWIPSVNDLSSGIVVFLVALPLCLGIALASGVPPVAGIISGIVGGIVVGFISGSSLSVSGPAAGLTAVILQANETLGSFELLLAAIVIAGVLQVIFGLLRVGLFGNYIPSSVILGMLAAIGLILIFKQIPHAIGYDVNYEGDESFIQRDGHNTFSELYYSLKFLSPGAVIISSVSLFLLIFWERAKNFAPKFFSIVPGALVVVILGIVFNQLYLLYYPAYALGGEHLVHIPIKTAEEGMFSHLAHPDFSQLFSNRDVWIIALIIGIVASIESLLNLEAVDRIDPRRRMSPPNRELFAQGAGNIAAGFLGGLPVTSVIVRSSVNVASGGKTRWSAIFHGILLIVCVLSIPYLLNMIPKSALAAILLFVGYKLTPVKLFRKQFAKGWDQFLPFIITIIAILFTDLLIGILTGMFAGILFVLRSNYRAAVFLENTGDNYLLKLNKDVSFLNKPVIRKHLRSIPENSYVLIDGTNAFFVDRDVMEEIDEFNFLASKRNIKVETRNLQTK